MDNSKTSRNDPCPCGSGKKYKQCCMGGDQQQTQARRAEGEELSKAIRAAQAFQQQGRLPEAEALYRQVLARRPDHPDALHFLGVIAYQVGRYDVAVQLIRQSLQGAPSATAYCNLGLAYRGGGQLDEAIACYTKAIALDQKHPQAYQNLGAVQLALGRTGEAVQALRKALAINSKSPDAHLNLARALQAGGDIASALRHADQAASLRGGHAETLQLRGMLLAAAGRTDDAAQAFRSALSINPAMVDALSNLGTVLQAKGQFADAILMFRKALDIAPGIAELHDNLGSALQMAGKIEEAIASHRKAVELKPTLAVAHSNLGNALQSAGQLESAIACFQRAIDLDPRNPEALNNLGNAFLDRGRLPELVDSYSRAVATADGQFHAHSNLLFALSFQGDDQRYLAEARRFGDTASARAREYSSWPVSQFGRARRRPLRVGVVSGDLKLHPVGHFMESWLPFVDRHRLELHAYVSGVRNDVLTERIRPHFAGWKSIVGLSDASAAEVIRADGVDILIDLAGHTGLNRLPVFAWKPAPVQATWLGYWASTGVRQIDYLLADPVCAPPGSESWYTETLLRFPQTRMCFSVPQVAANLPVVPPPMLQQGFVTYGSFQSLYKITDDVLRVWGEILAAVPSARLRIQNRLLRSDTERAGFRERLAAARIDPSRVALLGSVDRDAYLAAHAEIDLILDTFPYTGGTTTCEALWMGVPTLTVPGVGLIGRQGASLLTAAGLGEWVVADIDGYRERAIACAREGEALAALRARMRESVVASPVFDGRAFAVAVADICDTMWNASADRKS